MSRQADEEKASFHTLSDLGEIGGSNRAPGFFDRRLLSDPSRTALVQACYLSSFAILGALLRVVIAQIFGDECANPGTVGWLASETSLCVTADGEATREGGIIFADLPANLLGSFVMGMMQNGSSLGLPTDMGVAWMPAGSTFQTWSVLHLAIRTGFCGSLTTFSSWNSEMVMMMYGTGNADMRSQFFRGLFGYLVGLETAVGSYVFGCNVATWIFRAVNRTLAREEEATAKVRTRGVWTDRTLPDFERRFLPELDMDLGSGEGRDRFDYDLVGELEKWRVSTKGQRRVGDENLEALRIVEGATLVQGGAVPAECRSVAMGLGWDLTALEAWVGGKQNRGMYPKADPEPAHASLGVALPISLSVMTLLFVGLILQVGEDAPSVTYRTMWYAGLCAPFGALLRWRLSGLNGKLTTYNAMDLSWFPLGTLLANLLACVISIAAVAIDLRLSDLGGFWLTGTVRAVKVGFAGSLSTVSTFVSEIVSNMKKPNQYRGYKYILISLGLCGTVSTIMFTWIIYFI